MRQHGHAQGPGDLGAASLARRDVWPVGVLPPVREDLLAPILPRPPLLVLAEQADSGPLVRGVSAQAFQIGRVPEAFVVAAALQVARVVGAPGAAAGSRLWSEREGIGGRRVEGQLLSASAPLQAIAVEALRHGALTPDGFEVPRSTALHLGLKRARLCLADLLHEQAQLVVDSPPDAVLLARLVQPVKDLLCLLLGYSRVPPRAVRVLRQLLPRGRGRMAHLELMRLQQRLQVGGGLRAAFALSDASRRH
mmetsp:Transcript_15577/g.45538  ORF Transcript_15577/g.45538 Transcript_15577/m.45538 type:complete len:251 (+) Transcript_15577:875-1627(+)